MDAITTAIPAGWSFLDGGSELACRIREFDWARTSVGPIEGWPQVMKSTVGLILRSPIPIVTLWGDKGVMIYNDAYAAFAGARHPQILGTDVLEAWPEAADWNRQVMDTCFHRGETLSVQDMELTLFRNGLGEPVWMNLDYSPIPDEDGAPAGVIAIVVETTGKVRAEQRLSGERERLRQMFDEAPGFMALLEGPDHVFTMANGAYHDLIGGRDVIGKKIIDALPEVGDQGFVHLLDTVYQSGERFVGRATEVTLHRGDAVEQRFVDFIYQPLVGAEGEVTGVFVQGYDVTDHKRGERHQELLVGELNHRVKNTLAIVQSLTHQSFHSSIPAADAIRRFEGRLEALATAHNLLTRKNWESATIEEVALSALGPFCHRSRCEIGGPDVRILPQTAVNLALALHELATNASKYGALSSDTGTVSVRWSVEDGRLELTWTERGGPPVVVPGNRGFGTRMIERTLAAEFGGTVELEFRPEGVRCRVDAPLPALTQ